MKYEPGKVINRVDQCRVIIVGQTSDSKYLVAPYRLERGSAPGTLFSGNKKMKLFIFCPELGQTVAAFINSISEMTEEDVEMHLADRHAVSVLHTVVTKRNAPDTNSRRLHYLPKNAN
jgi:hypothetical protein